MTDILTAPPSITPANTPIPAPDAGDTTTVLSISGAATEASLLPRLVTLLTPLFAVGAGWVGSWVAQHTGAELDQTQIVAFMVVAATCALGAALKWLHGWQQHEMLVARGLDVPRRPGPNTPEPTTPR